jgi:Zn-dependent peptidase ImmA (M78 family)
MSNVGEMLRLARQRRGFTQKMSADRLGIPQGVLSRLENGLSDADDDLIAKASRVYETPIEFFAIREPVYGPPVSVHAMLRGKADVTAREVDMVTAEMNVRLFHIRRMLEGVDYQPVADLPSLDVEQYGTPEKIAATVRAHWSVPNGPIKDLTRLMERAGIIVGHSDFGGASISGVTFKAPGNPALVVVSSTAPADRMRFTLAHELGHLVMHRFPTADMESEANAFASAFLMPERDIRPAFLGRQVTLELLAGLKLEWRVAMQALLMRTSTLGIITSNQSRYLWQQISSRGWRLREPPETDFPREAPRVMTKLISTHLDQLGYSFGDLLKMNRETASDFMTLYGRIETDQSQRPKLRVV